MPRPWQLAGPRLEKRLSSNIKVTKAIYIRLTLNHESTTNPLCQEFQTPCIHAMQCRPYKKASVEQMDSSTNGLPEEGRKGWSMHEFLHLIIRREQAYTEITLCSLRQKDERFPLLLPRQRSFLGFFSSQLLPPQNPSSFPFILFPCPLHSHLARPMPSISLL